VSVPVHDPFGLKEDTSIPGVEAALDPELIQRWLDRERATLILPGGGDPRLREVRVIRHKPGRRSLLEYDLGFDRTDQVVTLIGKIYSRKRPKIGYKLARALWEAGFDDASEDAIAVPEPIGIVAEARMWLQRKVAGTVASDLIGQLGGNTLCDRVAQAAYKLHRARVPPRRAHGMAEELEVLHNCLLKVAQERSEWRERIDRLLAACDRLGGSVGAPEPTGVHRDFYSDQVIVDGERLWLIDFDLYCKGDVGVDIGNFAGHIIEQALRTRGDPQALDSAVGALVEGYLGRAGTSHKASIDAYTELTLVRHIYLSTLFEPRRVTTDALLALCEARLGRWM